MSLYEPLVRPGISITNRAELKYARAAHLANELRGRIDEWSAGETLLARTQKVDDHTVEFRMLVKQLPPIDEWSLILGDALHNLRSGFDNLMWALATMNGATPRTPSRVTFPVTTTEAEWRDRAKQLESVSPIFLQRIKELQPWADDLPNEQSLLWLLHHFDIVDKHRGLISGRPHFKYLSLAGLDWNLEPREIPETDLRFELRETPVAIEQDILLATARSTTHKLRPDPSYLATVAVQFFLAWDETRVLPLEPFIGDLLGRARLWLDRLYGGSEYAFVQDQARKSGRASAVTVYEDKAGQRRILSVPLSRPDESVDRTTA